MASLLDISRHQALPWDVTTCGWSPDEEEERLVRSKVIALLRDCVPSYWTKWANFKKRYLETYVMNMCMPYSRIFVVNDISWI